MEASWEMKGGRGGGVEGEIEPNCPVCLAENQSTQNGHRVEVGLFFSLGSWF